MSIRKKILAFEYAATTDKEILKVDSLLKSL